MTLSSSETFHCEKGDDEMKVYCRIGEIRLLPGKYSVRTNIIRASDGITIYNKGGESQPDIVVINPSAEIPTSLAESIGDMIQLNGDWESDSF